MAAEIDLDVLARELGITRKRAAAHIASAVAAGFLTVVETDDDVVTFAAAFPDETPHTNPGSITRNEATK